MAEHPSLTLLSEDSIQRILEQSYLVLNKVGVLIENEEALKLLGDAGAKVDLAKQKAFFPENIIESSLKSALSSISVFDRNGDLKMSLQGNEVHFDPGSAALTILDWENQRARKAVTRDLIQFFQVVNSLDNLAAQSTGLISSDVPREIQDRYRLFLALQHGTKPIVTGTFTIDAFESMKKMLIAVRGSEEKLREKPLAIFDCCPSPPLKWSNLTCQNLIDCAKSGIPAELVSMPLTGATAPGTIAGALVQLVAENLSGVVIHQLANPGAPIIWGGSPAAFDMRHGTTPMGAIETMMIDSAYAKIAKHLDLPTHAYMGLSDAKILDAQAGLETGIGAIIAALSGINVISGPGMLNFESTQSLEKLVVDNEICGMALRLVKGIELRENFSEDLFGNIYDGEHFLTSPHTLQWMREEFYFASQVISRENDEVWNEKGAKSAGERAHEKVKEIIAKAPPVSLDKEIANELLKIMQADAKKYGMDKLPL
ncbi:MAG: hypothetical protein GXO74_04480 [Calditrichaeota bacterium]|nr:hypothetical protein [Calditrichota bacterium]